MMIIRSVLFQSLCCSW